MKWVNITPECVRPTDGETIKIAVHDGPQWADWCGKYEVSTDSFVDLIGKKMKFSYFNCYAQLNAAELKELEELISRSDV